MVLDPQKKQTNILSIVLLVPLTRFGVASRRGKRHRHRLDVGDDVLDAPRSPHHQRGCLGRAAREQREGGLVEPRVGLVEHQRPARVVAEDLFVRVVEQTTSEEKSESDCIRRASERFWDCGADREASTTNIENSSRRVNTPRLLTALARIGANAHPRK